jgi:hypothetical protein
MRTHSILTLAIITFLASTAAEAKYSSGTGEPNNPYQIATAEDLNDIGNHTEDCNKHFILINDVNLAGYTGTQFKIIGNTGTPFTGVFDGNNQKIWNFTYSSTAVIWYIGLFGYLGTDGQIKDLGMENVDVNAVNGGEIGGLAGWSEGTITNCYSTGNVIGNGNGSPSGGLVAFNNEGTITNCYSTGTVSAPRYGGGLVGRNWGSISNCYSTCSVSDSDYGIGGLVGYNDGSISNCYSTGAVSGTSGSYYVGGLAGANIGSISNCYSTGSVSGTSHVGGLVGYIYGGSVVSSFWDTQTSGQTTSAGGTGKTTAEMKMLTTFTSAGWDFTSVWVLPMGQYPMLFLRQAGDLNLDGRVNMFDLAILAQHWLDCNLDPPSACWE